MRIVSGECCCVVADVVAHAHADAYRDVDAVAVAVAGVDRPVACELRDECDPGTDLLCLCVRVLFRQVVVHYVKHNVSMLVLVI